MPRRKFIRGVIDPVSLIGVLFLIITLSVGTHVVADKKYDFNIFEQAAKPKKTGNSAFDKCREESGREVCNERLGINVNWKGEIVNEIDTSKVDKNAPQGQPTCDANGVQYSPGAVVMYGGIGSNATCGSDGKWDVGVGATIDIKPENVPEYAKGSDKLKKQIEDEKAIVEVEKQATEQLATEQQTVTPQITITPSTADQENLDREKSQCLQEGGSWFANICSYAEQQQAIAKLTPIIQEQQEQKTPTPTVQPTTNTQITNPFANVTAGVSGGTIPQKQYVPPLLPTVPTVEDLINKIPGLEKLKINDVKTLDYPSSPQEENKKIFNWPKLEGLGTYGLGGGNAYVPPVPMNIINSENSSDFYNYAIGNTVSVGAGFASATLLTPGAPVSVFETITAIPRVVQALTLSDLADTAITGALCSQGNQDACAAFTATALIPGPAGSVNLIADSIEDFATSWAGTGSTISKLLNNIPSPALFNPSSSFDSFIPTNTTNELGLIADLEAKSKPVDMFFAPALDNLPNTPARVIMDDLSRPLPDVQISNPVTTVRDWWNDEMAKTNPNAFKNIGQDITTTFDNLKNGFELRSPISTDGKLQSPFEKTTVPNIENATEAEVPKIILWDEKSLNQNNLNVNQEITRIQQEIGITNTNVVTKIDQVKILDTVPLVTNKEVDAVEAILRGGDLKSTHTLISEGIVTQGHTSQFDIDRGLDKYIFSSWGAPETFSKSRYGDYMIILDPALLKQPTTLVSSGDVAYISDQLYSQSIISGADYLDTIKRITITGFDNPQQVIRGENLSPTDVTDKSSELLEIYRAWREPEVKIKGNISPDNILAIIVKNESEKIRLLELAKQNKSKIPIYTERELFGSDWLFRPDRPFDQIGREKIAELGQNSTTSLPANQNLPSTARDQAKNTINPPQPETATIFGFEFNGFKDEAGKFTLWPFEKPTIPISEVPKVITHKVKLEAGEPTVLDISNLPNANQYHLLNKAIPNDLKPLEDHLAKAASLIKAGKYDEAINLMMNEDLARKFGVSVELGRGVYLSENLKTNEISESDFINISDFIASVAKHELGSITAPSVSWDSLQDNTPIPSIVKREEAITFLEEWIHELQFKHQESIGIPYSKLHKDINHEDEVVLYLNNVLKIKLSEPYINRPFYDREQLGLRAYSPEEIMNDLSRPLPAVEISNPITTVRDWWNAEMAKTNPNAFKNIGFELRSPISTDGKLQLPWGKAAGPNADYLTKYSEIVPAPSTTVKDKELLGKYLQEDLANPYIPVDYSKTINGLIENTNGPLIEIGGPSLRGFRQIDLNTLEKPIVVTNINNGLATYNENTGSFLGYSGKVDRILDATHMNLPDESVGSFVGASLQEEVIPKFLEESYRTLEPGGIIVLDNTKYEWVLPKASDLGFRVIEESNNPIGSINLTLQKTPSSMPEVSVAQTAAEAKPSLFGFELRSPIGTDGKLQLPFGKSTVPVTEIPKTPTTDIAPLPIVSEIITSPPNQPYQLISPLQNTKTWVDDLPVPKLSGPGVGDVQNSGELLERYASHWDGQYNSGTHELTLKPKLTPTTLQNGTEFYDSNLATLENGIVKPLLNTGYTPLRTDEFGHILISNSEIPSVAGTDKLIFRGINYEGMQTALQDGSLNAGPLMKSWGAGDDIYFAPNAQRAFGYSGQGEGVYAMATFEKPSFVVVLKQPDKPNIDIFGDIIISKPITFNEIEKIYEIRPYFIKPGAIPGVDDIRNLPGVDAQKMADLGQKPFMVLPDIFTQIDNGPKGRFVYKEITLNEVEDVFGIKAPKLNPEPNQTIPTIPPPLTGISKFQEQVGSFGQKVMDGSLSTGAGLSPLKYVAGGIASAVFLDDYFDWGIGDKITNWITNTSEENNITIPPSQITNIVKVEEKQDINNEQNNNPQRVSLIESSNISTIGTNLTMETVPKEYQLAVFLTDTVNEFYLLSQTNPDQIIQTIQQSGLLSLYPFVNLSVYGGSGPVTDDNENTYALYIMAVAKLNNVVLSTNTSDFIKPGNVFSSWYGYEDHGRFQITQCVLWQNLLDRTFPELNLAKIGGFTFDDSGKGIERAQDVFNLIKDINNYSIIEGGKLYQSKAGGIQIMSFDNINNVEKGDTCVYGNHMCTILDKYKQGNKLYFLISEANSPNGKLDGAPQTYLVDEAGFVNLIGLKNTIFLRSNTAYLDSSLQNPTQPPESFLAPTQIVSQDINLSNSLPENFVSPTSIVNAAFQQMKKCVPGQGNNYNACEGEYYNNEILKSTAGINNSPWTGANSIYELYWCTQLVYDAAESAGLGFKYKEYSAYKLHEDMQNNQAVIDTNLVDFNKKDIVGQVAFVSTDVMGSIVVVHVAIVSEVISTNDATYVTVVQANSPSITTTYELDKNGKLVYKSNSGSTLYIENFGNLEIYAKNQ